MDLLVSSWCGYRLLLEVQEQRRLKRPPRVLRLAAFAGSRLQADEFREDCPTNPLQLLLISTLVIGTLEVVRLLHDWSNGAVFAFEAGKELSSAGFTT